MRKWVEEEAESARVYLRLAETAELWAQGKAGLWRDPDLGQALAWRERERPNSFWADRYHPNFAQAMDFLTRSLRVQVRRRRFVLVPTFADA